MEPGNEAKPISIALYSVVYIWHESPGRRIEFLHGVSSTIYCKFLSVFSAESTDSDEAVSPVCPGVWAAAVDVRVPLPHTELCQGREDDQESVRGIQEIPVSHSG